MFINNKGFTYIRNEIVCYSKSNKKSYLYKTQQNIHLKNSSLKNVFYICFEKQRIKMVNSYRHDFTQ